MRGPGMPASQGRGKPEPACAAGVRAGEITIGGLPLYSHDEDTQRPTGSGAQARMKSNLCSRSCDRCRKAVTSQGMRHLPDARNPQSTPVLRSLVCGDVMTQ